MCFEGARVLPEWGKIAIIKKTVGKKTVGEERTNMGRREAALALALLGIVSSLCLKGMQAVGAKLEEKAKR